MAYFGSIRFYKNLILLGVIIAIAVPTGLAVRWHGKLTEAQTELQDAAQAEVSTAAQAGDAAAEPPVTQDPAAMQPAVLAYQALYPDFYAPKDLHADQVADKTIFLTFDDGPSERTEEILDILKAQDVKATFFIVGHTGEAANRRMQRVVKEGHTLAMHSYSHNYKAIYTSVEAYLDDMYQLFTLMQDTTGVTPSIFRFPGGSINGYNHGIYQEIMAEMLRRGFVPYDWSLSSSDTAGESATPSRIYSNVVNKARDVNRAIVLMHDSEDKTATVDALSDMIDALREQGFAFAPLTADVKPILFGYIE